MEIAVDALKSVKDEFVAYWGSLGSAWGINRTMAQIHALLMVSLIPLSTDEIMEELGISRGNAHSNIKELVGWGLIRSVIRKGERKEFFEGEKDVWKIFSTIARERSRREIKPVLEILTECQSQSEGIEGVEAKAFFEQMTELKDFMQLVDETVEKVVSSEREGMMKFALSLLKHSKLINKRRKENDKRSKIRLFSQREKESG